MRLLLCPVLMTVLILLVSPPASPQEAAAFREGLGAVHRLERKGRGEGSLALLEKLLEVHREKDYVRARRQEVLLLHRRASFRAAAEPREPATLVSGQLEKYRASTGQIRITYGPGSLNDDFERPKHRLRYHAAAFTGPHTITMTGDDYIPSARLFLLCVGNRESRYFQLSLRTAADGGQVTLAHLEGDGFRRHAVDKKILPAHCKRRWVVRIKVGRSRIDVRLNGVRVASIAAPKNHFGYWAVGKGEFQTLTVEGPVEPSWIQGKQDAALEQQRVPFTENYDPRRSLPEWLFRAPPARREPIWGWFPVPIPADRMREFGMLRQEILEGPKSSAGERLRAVREAETHPLLKSWLCALHFHRQGDFSESMKHLEPVLAAKPEFKRGLVLRAWIHEARGHTDAATQDWEKLIELAPDYAVAYDSLALICLRRGQVEEAMIALDRGFGRVTDNARLERTRDLALKRRYGPDWPRVYEYKSASYHVMSDIDQATCYRAARVLEDGYRQYRVHLKWVKHAKTGRFRVYLFSGRTSYRKFTEDVLGVSPTRRTGGIYSRVLKQLFIWNAPEREYMIQAVRHEGFHQYLDRIIANPPPWLNEGLAEYYETADYRNGRWTTGRIRRDHLDKLAKGRKSLADLVEMSSKDFYAIRATRNYAHAWAFIHFLLHGPKSNQKLFERIFKALLEERRGDAGSAKRILGSRTLKALQPRFDAYLEELRRS